MNLILILFLCINLISFAIFGFDKLYAIKNTKRISEKSLHAVSLMGGFIGAGFAMILFRHKIKKRKFIFIQIIIYTLWIISYLQKSLLLS